MPRFRLPFLLGVLLLCAAASPARAGDEDTTAPKKPAEEKTPEDTALPKEMDAPELSVGDNEEPSPDFSEDKPPATGPAPRKDWKPKDLDENIDYSRLDDGVDALDPGRGVLAPALGFRGYRPNMVAVGGGDRVPGFGGIIEYSWNRIGAGITGSYRSTKGEDPNVTGYGLFGLYGLYRWLPFDMSPYFLLGVEVGRLTDEPFGGTLGLGIEARIYSGWTALLGWTYHSTVHRGFLGGAIGWSF